MLKISKILSIGLVAVATLALSMPSAIAGGNSILKAKGSPYVNPEACGDGTSSLTAGAGSPGFLIQSAGSGHAGFEVFNSIPGQGLGTFGPFTPGVLSWVQTPHATISGCTDIDAHVTFANCLCYERDVNCFLKSTDGVHFSLDLSAIATYFGNSSGIALVRVKDYNGNGFSYIINNFQLTENVPSRLSIDVSHGTFCGPASCNMN
jgi:hypothetical protein